MTVGSRIREFRKRLGLSVDDVAEKLGKNRATIYRYESDDIENLPAPILGPLAKVLHTTPAELMGWESPPIPTSKASSTAQAISISTASALVCTQEEVDHLKNYRQLDEAGRELVDSMIEKLHEQRSVKSDESWSETTGG